MKNIEVFLVDSEEELDIVSKGLSGVEYVKIVGMSSRGEEAVEDILYSKPDVVILDLILPNFDGLELIERVKSQNKNIKFIVTSAINSSVQINRALELGASYYMLKPVDTTILAKRIKEISFEPSKHDDEGKKMEEKITNIFITVGIPAHIKGYYFLREAIKMAVDDPHIINSITKRLYPSIANVYGTSASKVERAIRHAIEVAWNKGKIENINNVFGLRVYDTHEKPTNGEFIALVADKMLLDKNSSLAN